jgi:hypothetical protein
MRASGVVASVFTSILALCILVMRYEAWASTSTTTTDANGTVTTVVNVPQPFAVVIAFGTSVLIFNPTYISILWFSISKLINWDNKH